MRTIIMARTSSYENSPSRRNFKCVVRKGSVGGDSGRKPWGEEEEKDVTSFSTSSLHPETAPAATKKKSSVAAGAVSRFRSVMTAVLAKHNRHNRSATFGPRITGTLYGNRHGHVHRAFQVDSRACPTVLLELATPTSVLVREMASGLVRIALECEHKARNGKAKEAKKLMEESPWRGYCNGRKCGYVHRRECGPSDWKVLKAVEPVSMGAGVLPIDNGGEGPDGEMMYMRAMFERVVGSEDSEAFYMMNPDGRAGTELSIYFLRV